MPSPCTVSGNLKQLSNGVISQGQVIFELSNIGTGNPITVSGTGIFPALRYVTQSAADGSFSQALWGNDNLSPANTIYNITYRDNSGNEVGPIQYSITGGTANLNTLAAVSSTTPPVLAPAGASVLLNYQGPAAPITGTAAPVVYYTYTIPAGTILAGHGVRVTIWSKHTTGTANVAYTQSFGGSATASIAPTGNASQIDRIILEIFNNVGSTTAQTYSQYLLDSAGGQYGMNISTLAINTANSVVLSALFNVANTDAITPEMFLVELM